MNIWRFPYYINKPSLVQIGLQFFRWGHFHIFSLSYNLTSDDLWPWTMTFDCMNIWRFPSKHVAVRTNMLTLFHNNRQQLQQWTKWSLCVFPALKAGDTKTNKHISEKNIWSSYTIKKNILFLNHKVTFGTPTIQACKVWKLMWSMIMEIVLHSTSRELFQNSINHSMHFGFRERKCYMLIMWPTNIFRKKVGYNLPLIFSYEWKKEEEEKKEVGRMWSSFPKILLQLSR